VGHTNELASSVFEISLLRENIKCYFESERKYGFYFSLEGNMDILKTEIKYGHNCTRPEDTDTL
jgi:hypothetical protein